MLLVAVRANCFLCPYGHELVHLNTFYLFCMKRRSPFSIYFMQRKIHLFDCLEDHQQQWNTNNIIIALTVFYPFMS